MTKRRAYALPRAQVGVWLDNRDYDRLHVIAKAEGKSVSDFIRRLAISRIDQQIKAEGGMPPERRGQLLRPVHIPGER